MTMMTSPTEAPLSTKGLAGKSAIVTGSTSGIGLGIARAFAGAGMSVTLNGFGDKAEIDRTRAELEETFSVGIAYSAADMTKPDEIAGMVTEATKTMAMPGNFRRRAAR
jgi:3-hydroxybutyrate dehydrogenase